MRDGKVMRRDAGAWVGLRTELTPAKVVAGVGIGLVTTFLPWAGGLLIEHVSLREYVWPWGVLVFIAACSALLAVDNVRLRRRAGAAFVLQGAAGRNSRALDPDQVVGRDEEVGQVVEFVLSDERKFLCLHGPGGVGKTTVARAALSRLDGIRTGFVEVASVEERNDDPDSVEQALAIAVATQGLGVPLAGKSSPVEAVANVLRLLNTRMVLVIDNVEQVADRAAPLIHRWAQESPLARLIITSRVELGVGTEKLLEIDVFPTHPAHAAAEAMLAEPGPALELFVRRRADRHPGFQLNTENVAAANRICHEVGGLALGIELAAAVKRTLAEIEAGIRQSSTYLASSRPDLPQRQRSLAATIDWSLDLLEQDCYAVALQLSVAPGELDDDAIAGVVHAASATRPMYEVLAELEGANLLDRRERDARSTYREPVEVRRRCSELRRGSPREPDRGAWNRFATTFVMRAERARAQRYGPAIQDALDAVERDYENLVAITHRAEPTEATIAGRAGVCLAWMASIRRPSEPRLETLSVLEPIVPADQYGLLASLRAGLAAASLDLWLRTGRQRGDEARRWSVRALEAANLSGDPLILGEAHRIFALCAMRQNDPSAAGPALEAAAKSFIAARQFAAAAGIYARWTFLPPAGAHREKLTEAKRLLGSSNNALARYEVLTAEFNLWQQSQSPAVAKMRSLTSELRQLAEEINAPELRTRALHASALLESELGDQDRSFRALEEKAKLERAAGSSLELGLTTGDMAAVLLRRGPFSDENLDAAIRLIDEALPLVTPGGLGNQIAILYGNKAWALLNRGVVQEALTASEAAAAYFADVLQWDRPNAFIQAAVHARVRLAAGDPTGAASWADTARGLARENGFTETSVGPEIRRHVKWLHEFDPSAPARPTAVLQPQAP